ncbi:c-type cytochrome [Nevskia ramosa]|uniref:c-type cytochrome n=1 Tax=Nevskia ramosa TaxID=64002 RepID=UPI0003B66635|nr:hypothetical protein [Nevskia ramosa]
MLLMRNHSFVILLSLLATAALPARAALSPLASSCQGCHQPAVNAATMPALGGYSAARISASLRAARDQPEPGSIMARFALHLSDAEIDSLATELGKPAKAPAKVGARP